MFRLSQWCATTLILSCGCLWAQPSGPNAALEKSLLSQNPHELANEALDVGDPARGAILFHGATLGCGKCHQTGESLVASIGPNLSKYERKITIDHIVNSVLRPSQDIQKAYATSTVVSLSGQAHVGIVVSRDDNSVTLKTAQPDAPPQMFDLDDVDSILPSKVSIMPEGQVATLKNKQEFLDLVRYLIDIRDGGPERAKQLQPTPAQLALKLPEYENRVDHAGIFGDLDAGSLKRGREVYNSICINCHGTLEKAGSLPTALRFGEGKFKRGNDPLSMYRTLTHGFGLMLPQPWMVPQQKYDVIHYIREAFLKRNNPSQYFEVGEDYLAALPKGDTRGPAPQKFEPWIKMDYGPYLVNTYEMGNKMKNIAQKGIAVQLDQGGGGISRGNTWAVFDHDTFRLSGAWTGKGFIDWRGIHFNGNHGVHPKAAGRLIVNNLDGPGWADPYSGSFEDNQRIVGRDGRRFGPLPHRWAAFHGMYRHGRDLVISYEVGSAPILESMQAVESASDMLPVIARTLNIGPRTKSLATVVATHASDTAQLEIIDGIAYVHSGGGSVKPSNKLTLDGQSYGRLDKDDAFEMNTKDFTISATIRTRQGGTIVSQTTPASRWVDGGRTFFVRGGRLCFDIGWVGVVESSRRVNDNRPHHVAIVWNAQQHSATLYVDGKQSGHKQLAERDLPRTTAIQIGYTSENFPGSDNGFKGKLSDLRFFQSALSADQISDVASHRADLVAHWPLDDVDDGKLLDRHAKHHATMVSGGSSSSSANVIAGITPQITGAEWFLDGAKLCLRLPAGTNPLKFALWTTQRDPDSKSELDTESVANQLAGGLDLSTKLGGGPPLWPEKVVTIAERGQPKNGFAVDRLTRPSGNPWLARTRLTGLDFYDDGDAMAVCSWDGDVWHVTGLSGLDHEEQTQLSWRRIASGLFQPLGLKIVDGKLFVNCRDQIVILNDLNGDGETDYYQCFNDDHQVTEHFHEFAMGLQRDADGNFYYAKSARHAKTALVPHHGTLLRVSADGSQTDILATGFRAANGVCLNPDGSFIVTDQEGHWNPKNRINWVKPGGFYGNIYGYHDVTDESDAAMSQPLCWITNAFDRSPAELLWVESEKWGPLNGQLLNMSYGYGKVYVVPHEILDDQPQGGMCMLPIDQFPTGTMRGRFSPHDGQLYLCGMFAWASSQQQQEGGIYRLRYTGGPSHLPLELKIREKTVQIATSDPVDPDFAANPDNYHVKVWSLKRTANYGSKHYDEHAIKVTDAAIDDSGKTISLTIPELAPTWCMEIKYRVRGKDGQVFERVIHNTIHQIGDS